ncbi:Putative GTP binding domain, P-loop containing nucleoside triphosphate hydrolase [Colletotrichum destructivum]|uniref:GTP binding domain, P-loop containing nucleoside triphosphate hydrolase n=1 Tax=Colletotrichum destructivum TaxID=34406 RepID=A0AAX4J434_9PEZI|nr:Putative GTP binding domain, P-loop containing nucleoside triphosphate hydrolase [Colletotrichum destructivum]
MEEFSPRMEDDNLSQSSPPTETDLSSVRNGHEPRDTDIFLAVFGVTGVGKSSLVSHLTTDKNKPEVGHKLDSCTQDVKVYQYAYSATRNIYIIDTPGFNDTYRTDKSVLRSLVAWLSLTYKNNIRLHGILYLHRITDVRMQGSAKSSMTLFRQLCGADNLNRVVLVTTMWNKLEDDQIGVSREKELVENKQFWGCMVERGSQVERFYDTVESAQKLIDIFLPQGHEQSNGPPPQMELAIQREMVDQHKALESTSAGQEVCNRLDHEEAEIRTCIAEYHAEMHRLREERGLNKLQELEDLEKQIRIAKSNRERILHHRQAEMKKSMETLIRDNFDKDDVEPEEEKKKRLAKEYVVVGEFDAQPDYAGGLISTITSTRSGQNSNRPSFLSLHQVISPGTSQVMGQRWSKGDRKDISVSMSLRGKYCSLIGPAFSKSFIGRDSNTSCPTVISLGPQGSYFINVAGRKSMQCHPNAILPESISTRDIRRLWWGIDGSYILEREDDQLHWQLRGNYGGLESVLLETEQCRVKELALDIENPNAFALITTQGSVVNEGSANVVHSYFGEFATQHFGSRITSEGSYQVYSQGTSAVYELPE